MLRTISSDAITVAATPVVQVTDIVFRSPSAIFYRLTGPEGSFNLHPFSAGWTFKDVACACIAGGLVFFGDQKWLNIFDFGFRVTSLVVSVVFLMSVWNSKPDLYRLCFWPQLILAVGDLVLAFILLAYKNEVPTVALLEEPANFTWPPRATVFLSKTAWGSETNFSRTESTPIALTGTGGHASVQRYIPTTTMLPVGMPKSGSSGPVRSWLFLADADDRTYGRHLSLAQLGVVLVAEHVLAFFGRIYLLFRMRACLESLSKLVTLQNRAAERGELLAAQLAVNLDSSQIPKQSSIVGTGENKDEALQVTQDQ